MSLRKLSFFYFIMFISQPIHLKASENKVMEFSAKESTLQLLVEKQRNITGLVGLGAMIMQDGKVIASAVSGEREIRSDVLLTVNDKWHIGSITKSFTATMIARLVERGVLTWETSIKDVFSELEGLDSGWDNVTLEQLLTHTAGAPRDFPFLVNFKNPSEGVERVTARYSAVASLLRDKPAAIPGKSFMYSNVGFTIAGVMAEKATHLSWEELIELEIFSPLNIKSGGFGIPMDINKKLEQPRGHSTFLGVTISWQSDNTPIIGPAGTIHITLAELLLYANEHIKGEIGKGALLQRETYQRIHTPIQNNYAYGWVISPRTNWTNGSVFWHNGSNTKWYALLVLLPSKNAVMAITSNDGNINLAEKSAWKVIKHSINLLQ